MRQVDTVRAYLLDLQARITSACTVVDGTPFLRDEWEKAPGEPLQGSGTTMILEQGPVFERAGCGFSHVRGPRLPPSATQHRPELAGAPFEALGVSLVFHPRNPYAPTVHMNVRMISAAPAGGELKTSGGRVLCVTVLADNVKQAQQRAYALAARIHFDGAQYRKDIGYRAIHARTPRG